MSSGLQRLKEAVDMSLTKRSVRIPGSGGDTWSYWMTPLTIDQRKAAERAAGPKATEQDTGLQILIAKAMNKDGTPMFTVADLAELKRELPAAMLTDAMVQIINGEGGEDEDDEAIDPKSSSASSQKTKS